MYFQHCSILKPDSPLYSLSKLPTLAHHYVSYPIYKMPDRVKLRLSHLQSAARKAILH